MPTFEREALGWFGLIENEPERHGPGVVGIAAQRSDDGLPRRCTIRGHGYGMLIDIGQLFHIEGLY